MPPRDKTKIAQRELSALNPKEKKVKTISILNKFKI